MLCFYRLEFIEIKKNFVYFYFIILINVYNFELIVIVLLI